MQQGPNRHGLSSRSAISECAASASAVATWLSWSPPPFALLPPVHITTFVDEPRYERSLAEVAELPKLLRSAAVLEDHLIDCECVHIAGAEAVNCLADVVDEFSQSSL